MFSRFGKFVTIFYHVIGTRSRRKSHEFEDIDFNLAKKGTPTPEWVGDPNAIYSVRRPRKTLMEQKLGIQRSNTFTGSEPRLYGATQTPGMPSRLLVSKDETATPAKKSQTKEMKKLIEAQRERSWSFGSGRSISPSKDSQSPQLNRAKLSRTRNSTKN